MVATDSACAPDALDDDYYPTHRSGAAGTSHSFWDASPAGQRAREGGSADGSGWPNVSLPWEAGGPWSDVRLPWPSSPGAQQLWTAAAASGGDGEVQARGRERGDGERSELRGSELQGSQGGAYGAYDYGAEAYGGGSGNSTPGGSGGRAGECPRRPRTSGFMAGLNQPGVSYQFHT